MLNKEIIQTEKLMSQYRSAQLKMKKYNNYVSILSNLRLIKDNLDEYFDMYKILKQYYPLEFNNPELDNFKKLINLSVKKLNSNGSIKRDEITALSNDIKEKKLALNERWDKLSRDLSSDTLSTLVMIQNIHSDKLAIAKQIRDIKSILGVWPFKENDLISFQNSIENAKSFITSLDASLEVQEFIHKVAVREATLADMNDNILSWLKKNKFTANLSLSFNK